MQWIKQFIFIHFSKLIEIFLWLICYLFYVLFIPFFPNLQSKHSLANQLKQLQEEIEQLREQAEEEAEGREDAQRQLTKVNAELAAMKAKFDGEAVQRAEELEEARWVHFLGWKLLVNMTHFCPFLSIYGAKRFLESLISLMWVFQYACILRGH